MPCNKSIKFVPAFGLHRTPLSGRRLLLALIGNLNVRFATRAAFPGFLNKSEHSWRL